MTGPEFAEMSFAQQLQHHKDRLDLSQEAMAGVLDIAKRTLEYWLSGDRTPPAITQEGALARLAALDPERAQ